jgi:hypothetical protein
MCWANGRYGAWRKLNPTGGSRGSGSPHATVTTRKGLVGFTRLGNLLGLLDREEVPESRRHRVWLGELAGGRG